jgi:CubicO group peptidase (beta-lactamase class C family)
MRLSWKVVLLSVLFSVFAPPLSHAIPPDLQCCVDDLVAPLMDSGAMVGLVVGVIDREGDEVYGYGRVSSDTNEPPGGTTLFEVGAVTMVFCTLALADMAQSGEVTLTDQADQYLPRDVRMPLFADLPVRTITLLDLATHTSGLPRLPSNFAPADPNNPYGDYTVGQMYAFLSTYKMTQAPGDAYRYSNVGLGLLGHILERHAEQPFEDIVVQRICDPLGMADTRVNLSKDQKKRLAQGHDADGVPARSWHIPALPAVGAFRSTANDLLTFLSANLGFTDTPLSEAMAMTHRPERAVNARGSQVGLGWNIQPGLVTWHHGQTTGFHAFVGFLKELEIGVVVLTNSATMMTDRLGLTVLKRLAGEDIEPIQVRMPVALGTEVLDRYVGTYELPQDVVVSVFREDGRLMIQPRGQMVSRMYPLADTLFFLRVVDAEIEFLMDWETGDATHLIWTQGNQELAGKKTD